MNRDLGTGLVSLSIEGLGAAGEGFATWEGQRVWVPHTAPGDEVQVQLSWKGRVLVGALESVTTPSPFRREPPCSLAGRCGGCNWLHLSDPFQGAAKQKRVLDVLAHAARIDVEALRVRPLAPSSRPLAYRRRAALHVSAEGLFYFAKGTHTPVPLKECPALVPPLQERLTPLAAVLVPHAQRLSQVLLAAENDVCSAALVFTEGSEQTRRGVGEEVLKLGFAGVVLQLDDEGRAPPVVLGEPELRALAVGTTRVPLYSRPDAFAQAHADGNVELVTSALEMLRLKETDHVLELFGGNGNFTFGMAHRCGQVWMVEGSPVASRLARRSADEGGVKNVRLILGEVGQVVSGLVQEKQRFDVVLADPPRSGARELGSWARDLQATRVVYVACDADSLARDARHLIDSGFRAQELATFDLFPQTHHLEALMSFER